MRFIVVRDLFPEAARARTVEAVADVLKEVGETEILSFDTSLIEKLRKDDIVFNLAIGKRHDFLQGTISAIMEGLGNEFVGSPAYTHYVCLDKFTTKSLLGSYGIPTPVGALFDGKCFVGDIPVPPLIVKPVAEGSGIGVDSDSLCNTVEMAKKTAIEKFEKFREPIMIEKYLSGVELTVGVIGFGSKLKVLPPLEIDFSNLPYGVERFYSRMVKEEYASQTIYRCPALLDAKVQREVLDIAKKTFEITRARDYLRIDMRLDKGQPYVIEVNSMPGLDPQNSDIPKMIKAISKDYEWLIRYVIKRAVVQSLGVRK